MISISDSEEPTCPRPPPSSARTTRRRRCTERSSSGGDCRGATGKTSFAIGEPPKVRAQALHPFACPIKLAAFRRFPVRPRPGAESIGPPLRQEFVQQDHAPAQCKQRVQEAKPS